MKRFPRRLSDFFVKNLISVEHNEKQNVLTIRKATVELNDVDRATKRTPAQPQGRNVEILLYKVDRNERNERNESKLK